MSEVRVKYGIGTIYTDGKTKDAIVTKRTVEEDVYEEEEEYIINVKELYALLDKLKIVKKTGYHQDYKTKTIEEFK